ncbi:MAG: hypothetical protein BYD32DRAFT_407439 [Podila humilis]|nr:MAG: hypothetical protein BYD32DRAFT_407439 [Podila humilis]
MRPSTMDTTATSRASSTTCPASNEPFTLLTHPAIVYSSSKLADPEHTARFQTVNVFDFDHTLFQSPLPNPALWDPSFIGVLISWNHCYTGWWHNPGTLDLGPEAEATVWDGWWNEDIVRQVELSVSDPTCLTILLTGRNGPLYGDRLISMMKAKQLDFDIIATKPTTVARIEGAVKETYLKVHTFNTKHDFLYNVLYEYPDIDTMCLWDDRPGQIAKFREAGQEWLDNKMLSKFEIKVVQEPHIYMDPKREIDLVFAMVEANNKQVEAEEAGGRPLVTGVGPMPRTRPELKNRGIWDPYELYSPLKRHKMAIAKVPRYTGVMFSEPVHAFLRNLLPDQHQHQHQHQYQYLGSISPIQRPSALQNWNQSTWVVPEEFHVALCPGTATPDFLESIGGIGATVLVELAELGALEGKIWAWKVKEFPVSELDVDRVDNNDSLDMPVSIVAPDGHVYSSLEELRNHYSLSSSSEPATIQNGHPHSNTSTSISTSATTRAVNLNHLGHIHLRKEGVPYITMAYDHRQGARAMDSASITDWEPIRSLDGSLYPQRIVLVGTIGEKRLFGMKARNYSALATVPRVEVSIAKVIMNTSNNHHQAVPSGRELGEMIRRVQAQMVNQKVDNKLDNLERITDIAREVIASDKVSR